VKFDDDHRRCVVLAGIRGDDWGLMLEGVDSAEKRFESQS